MSKYDIGYKVDVYDTEYTIFSKFKDVYTLVSKTGVTLYLNDCDIDKLGGYVEKPSETKPELALVEPGFTKGVAEVLMLGATKYGARSYREYDRKTVDDRLNSLYRHLLSYLEGKKTDNESGLNNLLHIAANCMIIHYHDDKEKETK